MLSCQHEGPAVALMISKYPQFFGTYLETSPSPLLSQLNLWSESSAYAGDQSTEMFLPVESLKSQSYILLLLGFTLKIYSITLTVYVE